MAQNNLSQEHISFFINTQNELEKLSKKKRRKIALEFRNFADKIKLQISDFYEKYGDENGKLSREEMSRYNRLQKFEQFLNEEVGKLTRNNNTTTRQAIIEAFTESYYRYGYMIESAVLASLSYGALNPKKIEAILFNPLDLIKWSDRSKSNMELMKRQVKEVLMQGMVQGHSYGKMSKLLTERINIGANKAIRIVQTETHRATSGGNLEAMKHAQSKGVEMQKRWVSTLDSRTRDTHKDLDGQTVNVDEQFKSGSRRTDAPSHFGVAREDINCRCSMISIVKGYEPTSRRARKSDGKNEVIPYKNYREWEKQVKSK